MKPLAIALKDIQRAFQSPLGLLNLFVLPLAITGIIYLAFGGSDIGSDIAATDVIIVNQDQAQYGFSAGDLLTEILSSEGLSSYLAIREQIDPASARQGVDDQEAGVALLIPADLSLAMTTPGVESQIVVYSDPTLTLAPGMVRDIVAGVVDGMTGSSILSEMVTSELEARGEPITEERIREIVTQYTERITPAEGAESGQTALVSIEAPPTKADATRGTHLVIASVMAGIMVYYAFLTAGNTAETILREEKELTLQRLFSTPTSPATVYLGKLLYITVMVAGQGIVLHLASSLLFGIRRPALGWSALLLSSLTIAAAGFALFWMSLAKTRQQAGGIIGAVFTAAGMLGGCFTVGVPNYPEALDTAALMLPHGWAMRAWKAMLQAQSTGAILFPIGVLLAMGLIYFGIGTLRFHKRFA